MIMGDKEKGLAILKADDFYKLMGGFFNAGDKGR